MTDVEKLALILDNAIECCVSYCGLAPEGEATLLASFAEAQLRAARDIANDEQVSA